MKVLHLGKTVADWRLVVSRETSTECVHGKVLTEPCVKCRQEMLDDGIAVRSSGMPYQVVNKDDGFCIHGKVVGEERCDECADEIGQDGEAEEVA